MDNVKPIHKRKAPKAPVLRLAPSSRSQETIDALSTMLADAVHGKLIGLALIGQYAGNEYVVDIVGKAKQHLTLTRGQVRTLDDELAKLINEAPSG